MGFSLDTRGVKTLYSYETALKHHDSITPIRGRDTCRPLAERRKTNLNIRKQGDAVVVRLYATDIVTYTPDNRITLNIGRWNSVSTREAIRAVAGVNLYGKGPVWVRDHNGKYYVFKNGMQLQTQGLYQSPTIIDPIYPTIHTLNRKELNKLRNEYGMFIAYLKGFVKLVGEEGFTGEMFASLLFKEGNPSILSLAKGTQDEMHEGMHEAALHICDRAREWPRHYSYRNPPGSITVKLKKALAEFDYHLIKAHADTVLTKTTITDGRRVKDHYAWASGGFCLSSSKEVH